MAHTYTSENFEQEVLKSAEPVLVDFWAPWCTPCKVVGPVVEEIAAEFEGKGAKVGKVNVDEQGAIGQQYGVMSIPTLIVFKNGAPVAQVVGVQPKEKIVEMLQKAI
jgi:thioredoxin 1